LTALGQFSSNIVIPHNQELHDQVDRIEQHIASLEVADQQVQEKEAQDDMYKMAQGTSRTHLSLLSGNVCDRLGAEDRQDTEDVSTVTVAVTNHTENLLAYVAQANAGNNPTGLLSLGQSANQVFTPHFYQRLPHTLSYLLKELPVVDGTDISFLRDVF
jgi:L-lactate utilization protein LutC